jgi:hypothetical protein
MTESLRRVSSENERLLAETRHEADTDALTGLPNRRHLERHLGADDRLLTLELFDLDGFKEYNDTFGHPTGDSLLARMGDRLRRSLQEGATAYRMGGRSSASSRSPARRAGAFEPFLALARRPRRRLPMRSVREARPSRSAAPTGSPTFHATRLPRPGRAARRR